MGQAEKVEKQDRASTEGMEHMFVSDSKADCKPAAEEPHIEYVEAEELETDEDTSHFEQSRTAPHTDISRAPDSFFQLLAEKDKTIQQLQERLESMSWRSGYLEHKVASQEKEIKLLTTQKKSWFGRIKEMFR